MSPRTKLFAISMASARNSGVKSIRSFSVAPICSNGAGLVGIGCVGCARSPGTVEGGTGISSIGHTGSPVNLLNTYVKPVFDTWATALIGLSSTTISTKFGAEAIS